MATKIAPRTNKTAAPVAQPSAPERNPNIEFHELREFAAMVGLRKIAFLNGENGTFAVVTPQEGNKFTMRVEQVLTVDGTNLVHEDEVVTLDQLIVLVEGTFEVTHDATTNRYNCNASILIAREGREAAEFTFA